MSHISTFNHNVVTNIEKTIHLNPLKNYYYRKPFLKQIKLS